MWLLRDRSKLVSLAISVVFAFSGGAAREQERADGHGDNGSDGDHGGRDFFIASAMIGCAICAASRAFAR
ncbi:MAG TPA: hypothetical protein VIX73_36570 [Kofleriaceae bacterium]